MPLSVSEIFGPTIQGEGPSAGRHAVFLRLSGCNLACTWCDTPYTWDWTRFKKADEATMMSIRDVRNDLATRWGPNSLLVITGGEPLLQMVGISDLFDQLPAPVQVEIETNGTLYPPAGWNMPWLRFNISPKLASSGEDHKMSRALNQMWRGSKINHIFKFVVTCAEDFEEIDKMNLDPSKIWVMPEGTTKEAMTSPLAKMMAQDAIDRGWNFSTRLHVLLWGNERAR